MPTQIPDDVGKSGAEACSQVNYFSVINLLLYFLFSQGANDKYKRNKLYHLLFRYGLYSKHLRIKLSFNKNKVQYLQ